MYLQARKYVRGYNVSIKKSNEYQGYCKDWQDGAVKNVSYLIIETGYWRKANAIHKWFVDNVQDGEDDCKEYYVDESKLKELLDVVNKVLDASKLVSWKVNNGWTVENGEKKYNVEDGKLIEDSTVAQELLPCAEGFFFGSTDYDEGYYNDLVDTKKIIETALQSSDSHYYHSSW